MLGAPPTSCNNLDGISRRNHGGAGGITAAFVFATVTNRIYNLIDTLVFGQSHQILKRTSKWCSTLNCRKKQQKPNSFCFRVISGVGLTKVNRIIQLKILERELLPNGQLGQIDGPNSANSQSWRTSKEFSIDDYDVEEGIDFHTLTWEHRAIDLDSVVDSGIRVVTGIRFRVVNSHLRLEVRVTNFDYNTGKLIDIQRSEWIHNNDSFTTKKKLELQYPDRSTRSKQKSIPIRGKNHYIEFQPSDINADASQSTVPFLDGTLVESKKPLAGVGLYYKTQLGSGGFIAPKLIVFDAAVDMTPINNF